ncbi:hypothetical protein CBZ_14050 [Cellulomonas biazotea]|uniref:Manganese efflux pump MntP n=1 Tax=Cellulomonas biazotea TaxID=1709 RepID=A0A402DQD8_9CELL|nr:hypothetical protein CBZ_14050 [Cellulomonas biazotea]
MRRRADGLRQPDRKARMSPLTLLLIAFSLSADAFAVALGKGLHIRRLTVRDTAAIAVAFGAFQGLMPVLGWFLGVHLQGSVSRAPDAGGGGGAGRADVVVMPTHGARPRRFRPGEGSRSFRRERGPTGGRDGRFAWSGRELLRYQASARTTAWSTDGFRKREEARNFTLPHRPPPAERAPRWRCGADGGHTARRPAPRLARRTASTTEGSGRTR